MTKEGYKNFYNELGKPRKSLLKIKKSIKTRLEEKKILPAWFITPNCEHIAKHSAVSLEKETLL